MPTALAVFQVLGFRPGGLLNQQVFFAFYFRITIKILPGGTVEKTRNLVARVGESRVQDKMERKKEGYFRPWSQGPSAQFNFAKKSPSSSVTLAARGVSDALALLSVFEFRGGEKWFRGVYFT